MTPEIKTYNIISQAKINIGLRVLSKRKDGFHNIETIFYPIRIYDDINIKIKKFKRLKTTIISVRTTGKYDSISLQNEKNICYKAVQLFLENFNIKGSYEIKINIKKQIPVGAGLGGGSSNAASILKILGLHFGILRGVYTERSERAQKEIALELGSDVPFFLYGKPAYATDRGETLTPLPKYKVNYKILVINTGIQVSTAWAYNQLRPAKRGAIKNYDQRSAEQLRIKKQLYKRKTFKISESKYYINDFEEPVFKKYPVIEKIKQEMYQNGAVFASMSGSGSSVYGFFNSKKIKAAKNYFSSLNCKSFTL